MKQSNADESRTHSMDLVLGTFRKYRLNILHPFSTCFYETDDLRSRDCLSAVTSSNDFGKIIGPNTVIDNINNNIETKVRVSVCRQIPVHLIC